MSAGRKQHRLSGSDAFRFTVSCIVLLLLIVHVFKVLIRFWLVMKSSVQELEAITVYTSGTSAASRYRLSFLLCR